MEFWEVWIFSGSSYSFFLFANLRGSIKEKQTIWLVSWELPASFSNGLGRTGKSRFSLCSTQDFHGGSWCWEEGLTRGEDHSGAILYC